MLLRECPVLEREVDSVKVPQEVWGNVLQQGESTLPLLVRSSFLISILGWRGEPASGGPGTLLPLTFWTERGGVEALCILPPAPC